MSNFKMISERKKCRNKTTTTTTAKKTPIKVDQIGGNKLALNPKKNTNVGGGGGDQQQILSEIFFEGKKESIFSSICQIIESRVSFKLFFCNVI